MVLVRQAGWGMADVLTVSALIVQLQSLLAAHGDIGVFVEHEATQGLDVPVVVYCAMLSEENAFFDREYRGPFVMLRTREEHG